MWKNSVPLKFVIFLLIVIIFVLTASLISYFLGLHQGSSAIKNNRFDSEKIALQSILDSNSKILRYEIFMNTQDGEAVASVVVSDEEGKSDLKEHITKIFGSFHLESLMFNVRTESEERGQEPIR